MHAMADSASTPVPKPRRLILRRVLLALLLGLATWWGVGWWLSARPLYTLHFPDIHEDIWNLQAESPLSFLTHPIDREGRLLFVLRPKCPGPGQITIEVVELATGQTSATHVISEELHRKSPFGYYPQLAWLTGPGQRDGSVPIIEPPFPGSNFWYWNLLTNERQLVRSFPYSQRGEISRDGTTFVTEGGMNLAVPAMPSFDGLLGYLANLKVAEEDVVAVRIHNIWALPTFTHQCSIVIPAPFSLTRPILSPDGRRLVFSDDVLRSGLQSKYRYGLSRDRRSGFLRDPKGIRIYDTRHGRMEFALDDYEQFMLVGEKIQDPTGETVSFFLAAAAPITDNQALHRTLHLRTKTWLPGHSPDVWDAAQAPGSPPGTIRWIALEWTHGPNGNAYPILQTELDGRTEQVKSYAEFPNYRMLVPSSSQIVLLRNGRAPLAESLDNILPDFEFLRNWRERTTEQMIVLDYENDRQLFVTNSGIREQGVFFSFTPLRNMMIVHRLIPTGHEISVFRLPLPSWSSWWSRSAGLLIAAFILFARRRRPALSPS